MTWQWHALWITPTALVVAYLFLGGGQAVSGQEDCVARARTRVEATVCGERDRDYLKQKAARSTENGPARTGARP